MERTAYAALALLALIYIILGGWLGRAWGINPSRSTPRCERTGEKRGGWLLLFVCYALALAFLQGMACTRLLQAQGDPLAFVPVLAAALPGGVISMLALFVSIRHDGQSLPEMVSQRHGVWLGRGMYALCALSMALCAAALLAMMPQAPSDGFGAVMQPEHMDAYALLMLYALCAAFPSFVCAPRLRSEGHIRRVGLGGVLMGLAAAAAFALPGVRHALAQRIAEDGWQIGMVLCACTALCAAYLACVAAKGLFARKLFMMRRKPKAEIAAPLGTLALIALLTRADFGCLMGLAGVTGAVYALLSLLVCMLWLNAVGRRLL